MCSGENCTLDAQGNLMGAEKITWFHDPDGAQSLAPIQSSSLDVDPKVGRPKVSLQGKEKATTVAGKRTTKATSKAQASSLRLKSSSEM